MLVITLHIGHWLGLVSRSHSHFLRSALPAKTPEDEEGAAESCDEDNRDGNSSNSSCTNTVRTIADSLHDGGIAGGWIGGCGTSCAGMRYGYDMAWHRRVEGCLRD